MNHPAPATPQPKPASRKQRHYIRQYSLRGLLILLTIVAVLTAWLTHQYRLHQQEQVYLQNLIGVLSQTQQLKIPGRSPDATLNGMSELLVVAYDYQCNDDGTIDTADNSWGQPQS